MYCENCGKELMMNASFCNYCGCAVTSFVEDDFSYEKTSVNERKNVSIFVIGIVLFCLAVIDAIWYLYYYSIVGVDSQLWLSILAVLSIISLGVYACFFVKRDRLWILFPFSLICTIPSRVYSVLSYVIGLINHMPADDKFFLYFILHIVLAIMAVINAANSIFRFRKKCLRVFFYLSCIVGIYTRLFDLLQYCIRWKELMGLGIGVVIWNARGSILSCVVFIPVEIGKIMILKYYIKMKQKQQADELTVYRDNS